MISISSLKLINYASQLNHFKIPHFCNINFKRIIWIIYFSKNYPKDYSFQPPSKILQISVHSTSLSPYTLFPQAPGTQDR